jgi:hypothetical protein
MNKTNLLRLVSAATVTAVVATTLGVAHATTDQQAAATPSALKKKPAADKPKPQPAADKKETPFKALGFGPMDVLDLLELANDLISEDPAPKILDKLDGITQQIRILSTNVNNGFNQLELDIAKGDYANAENALTEVKSQAQTGFEYLATMKDPAKSDTQRNVAQVQLRDLCPDITVLPRGLMEKYYGDPESSMSENGLLPAAWDVLMAGERSAQQAKAGAAPAFLSYRTLRQMRRVGAMAEWRIVQYAVVRGACDALKFTNETDRQTAATEVHTFFIKGTNTHPGLGAIEQSMPAALPRRTGVFPRSTVGVKGLVVGNFNIDQNITDGKVQIFSVPWSAPLIGRGVIASPVTIYADGRIRNENETTPEDTNVCLSSAPTGGFVFAYPVDFVPCDANSPSQKFIVEEGQIRLDSDRSQCLTQRRLTAEYGGAIETTDCDNLAPYWWFNGPIPGVKDLTGRRLYLATTQGSPTGDNPASASGPWSREWTYIKNEWMDEIQKDVAASGSSLEALSSIYGGPTSEGNVRILPFHQVGWKDSSDHGWVWNSGPSGAPSGPFKDTRVTSVKMDNTKPATTVNWEEVAVYAPQASNYFFGVPVVGCAYRFERPKAGGFNCPTRK